MRPNLTNRTESEKRHQDYLDRLPVPTLETVEHIAEAQEEREREIDEKYEGGGDVVGTAEADRRDKAASTIQRNYRGYRLRRELSGLNLNPSTRWTEAIREVQYRNLTKPHKRPDTSDSQGKSQAKQNWKRISKITHHAHGELPTSNPTSGEDTITKEHSKHAIANEKETWRGKMMDLPYFLEMVDQKHRYGSSLRAYHAEWKKADTHENFFYWLDHGEGRDVEIPTCSRERLAREQVRYLSREERMQYLVVVDEKGRLCWWKNNQRIDTTEDYRDSVEGIVPLGDTTKAYREDEIKEIEMGSKRKQQSRDHNSESTDTISSRGSGSSISDESSKRYPDPPNFQETRGPSKIKTVSPHLILNRLLRTTVKKNTWIFAADTSMNLYVGIKQSGSFQHSSFLHGSRISAAGLIKIKHGQLRSLSPLSGHYRPPARAFQNFVHHLRDAGVDMSRVSISKAYAVLVGLEAYISTKQRTRKAGHKIKVNIEKVVAPEKAKQREEREKDPSQSARLEEEKLKEIELERGTGVERVLREVRGRVAGSDVATSLEDRGERDPGKTQRPEDTIVGREGKSKEGHHSDSRSREWGKVQARDEGTMPGQSNVSSQDPSPQATESM